MSVKRFLVLAFILILGLFGLGFMHEQVHVQIYAYDGIESHVEYFSHFPDFVTIAEENCKTDYCQLSHNINEIVGYHLLALYTVFAILILFFYIEKLKKEELG